MGEAGNLLANLPDTSSAEIVEMLFASGGGRIERIVSAGQVSPEGFWYDQQEVEFVLLVAGAARLCFEDRAELVTLHPGDHVTIAARRRHRVEWTDPTVPTIWLAVHLS